MMSCLDRHCLLTDDMTSRSFSSEAAALCSLHVCSSRLLAQRIKLVEAGVHEVLKTLESGVHASRGPSSHPEHLHRLIPKMIDDLDRDSPGPGLGEGP